MNISIDLRGFEKLGQLDDQIERAAETGLDAGIGVVERQKAKQIQKTYNRKIPQSKTGRPKWERSGDWMRGQRVEEEAGLRRLVTVGNAAKYEDRLANLPTGPDGINRTNKASEEAARITEPQIKIAVEQAIRNALN